MMNSPPSTKRRKYAIVRQILAAVVGAGIWGWLFSVVGLLGNQGVLGTIAGVIIGSIIGVGFARGQIGPIVPCMTAFAVLGAALSLFFGGHPLITALCGAAIGGFLGATGLRGLLALIGSFLGAHVGTAFGILGMWTGLAVGAGLGWCVGHCLLRIWRWLDLDL